MDHERISAFVCVISLWTLKDFFLIILIEYAVLQRRKAKCQVSPYLTVEKNSSKHQKCLAPNVGRTDQSCTQIHKID